MTAAEYRDRAAAGAFGEPARLAALASDENMDAHEAREDGRDGAAAEHYRRAAEYFERAAGAARDDRAWSLEDCYRRAAQEARAAARAVGGAE